MFTTDFFLETISYGLNCNDSETIEQLQLLIPAFQQLCKDSPIYDCTEYRYYLNLIQALLEENQNITKTAELAIFREKWLTKIPVDLSKRVSDTITTLLAPDNLLSDKLKQYYSRKINNTLIWCQLLPLAKRIQRFTASMGSSSDVMKHDLVLHDILHAARDIVGVGNMAKASRVDLGMENIDLSDKTSILKALQVNRKTRQATHMSFGLQGLNNMFNKDVMRLGQSILFAALSHNYKSGILMDCARWIAMYSTPPRLSTGIPTIQFISLENEAHTNMLHWFRRSYALIYKQDPNNLTDDEIADHIIKHFSSRGWKLQILRRIGENFGFQDYCNLDEEAVKAGDHVYVRIIDYPALMREGQEHGSSAMLAKSLQGLYHGLANHAKHNNQLLIMAHQLNSDADRLAGMEAYPVKKFRKHHLENSKGIFNEIDVCIFMHKTYNTNGDPYMTFNWAKARDCDVPASKDKFFAQKFQSVGLLDDIQTQPQWVTDIFTDNSSGSVDIEDDTIFG